MTISSERLDLVPFPPAFLRLSLEGDRVAAGNLLGALLPAEWPDQPHILQLRLAQLEHQIALQPWLLRGMVLRQTRQLVGHIGFHTSPDPDYLRELAPGGIEFGYTVFEPFRRKGFATEAATALMAWATARHGVTRFVVSIRPENIPSLAMAQQLGFQPISEHMDPVDGLEMILRRDV